MLRRRSRHPRHAGSMATMFRPACLAVLAGLAILLAACAAPEHKPGAPWHHTTTGFRNPPGSPERNPWWMRLPWLLTRPVALAFNPTVPPADHLVPPAEAVRRYGALEGENTLTWIGHMTALLRLGGKTVLTDPWFSDYASPMPPLGPKRYVAPGIAIADLPPIDVVLVSHNHFDHLDLPAIEELPGRRRITAIVPLGLGHYFEERGYGRVIELDWHETAKVHGIAFTAMPVIHWSKRSISKTDDTLWAGFAIEAADGQRLYFGGDAEYGPVYKENAKLYGGFDVVLLSIGAFTPRIVMNGAHCVPADCLKMGLDLGAHTLAGLHWGTGPLGSDDFSEPPDRFRAAAKAAGIAEERVWIMRIGETRVLPRR